MGEQLTKRLVICIAIEATTAEIYRSLSRRFREARDFWSGLASSEERHTKILLTGGGYLLNGRMPESLVPHSESDIDGTYRLVNDVKNRVEDGSLSLREALAVSLEMENSVGERYFQEVMSKEADFPVISGLQQLYTDEKLHSEMILDFMKNNGLV